MKNPPRAYKERNYHLMLEHLLRDVIDIHNNPRQLDNFKLRIGNKWKFVNLRIPVAFVISDTQGADKLCGRYVFYKENVQRLHRTCKCSPGDATNTDTKCVWVKEEEMMGVIARNDKDELAKYSQHSIPLHAFRSIDFGGNPYGIYGATPSDNLHVVKLGIMKYTLEIFLEQELKNSGKFYLNQALTNTLPHLKQGAINKFPRMYFPSGITSLGNTTAEEVLGIMFVIYLLCNTTQGRDAVLKNLTVMRLNMFVKAVSDAVDI